MVNCLLTCMIWFGGYGHLDTCRGKVDIIFETQNYYYVRLIQSDPYPSDMKIEININQRVNKYSCEKKVVNEKSKN